MAEKKTNFAELSMDELKVRYKSFKEELFNLRFQYATGKLENTSRLKTVRKNIARVMTFMHQAEMKETPVQEGYLPPRSRSRRNRRALQNKAAQTQKV
jgi:large subunit ribosomal protein L29